MIIIETMKKQCRTSMMQGFGGLLLLGISVSAWGVCVQDTPGASTIVSADGTQACENISGQTGCRIEKGVGTCDAHDASGNVIFTAVSNHSKQGGLSWSIIPDTDPLTPLTTVDAVAINGARGGNACVYIYGDEATSGSGMGDYDVNKSNFANVQFAEFCTDGENQTVEPSALPDCGEIGGEQLDGTGINCDSLNGAPRFLISLDPEDPNWNATACTCNVIFNECNEDATVMGGDNKCTADNPLKALPVHWEAGNDGTYICRTIGGVRKCWSR